MWTKREGPAGPPSIYIAHNNGWSFDDPESDNWTMIEECGIWDPSDTALSDSFKRTDPLDPVGFPITVESIDIFADNLLLHVGASQRLNADGTWVDVRDAVDSRIIMDYLDGTGFIPENEDQVSGFPVINGGTPYADSDGDGMSDVWEDANGFDKNDAGDGNGDADGDGYTNVEEFING